MAQARDELFLKLALRQGLFNQQEAVQFLNRYRSEGAPGEGIAQWLVAQGAIEEEQAAMIADAIAQRAEGHVADTRRRVPKTHSGGAGSGSRVAQAHHAHGHHGTHAGHRHGAAPRGKPISPAQQVLYIGSGVLFIGLLVFLVMQFQKGDPRPLLPETSNASTEPAEKPDAAKVAARLTEGEAAPAAGATAPQWTPQEIESMRSRINDAVKLARSHLGDGRPGRGIETIRKRVAELGESLPASIQALVDEEVAELQKVVDLEYEEALADLRTAKGKGDASALEEIYAEIELSCGPEYVEKAKKALE